MNGKIRALNYTPVVNRNPIRREVGKEIRGSNVVVHSITYVPNDKTGIPTFVVRAINEKDEVAVWKEVVCPIYEIEYDIVELLR